MVKETEEDTCDPVEAAWDELLEGALVGFVAFGGNEPTTFVRNDAKLEVLVKTWRS